MLTVERMPEERNVNNVRVYIPKGKGCFGKSRKIWLDDVENEMKKMGVEAGGKWLGI